MSSLARPKQWEEDDVTNRRRAGEQHDQAVDAQRDADIVHFLRAEQFGLIAVSLGYFDTLMSCSGSTTSSEMTDEHKEDAGISPGLVRMSIGYTGTTEQRWRQLRNTLERLGVIK